ncbi:MAG: hypothetical protein PVH61_22495 [Candidatus Aminicenantes bacterium]|jgi:hypothetical protein
MLTTMLKEKVKRIIRAKIQIFCSLSNLCDMETWSKRLDESAYDRLLSQNKIEAEKMARASVVLISEKGNIINTIGDSNYFGPNKGPLKRDEILQGANDKLTIVSPIYYYSSVHLVIKDPCKMKKWKIKKRMI